MSELTERGNILTINELSQFARVNNLMVNLDQTSIYQPLNIRIRDIKTFCNQNIQNALNATNSGVNVASSSTMLSPNMQRAKFGNIFNKSIKELEKDGYSSIASKKASLVASISQMDYKVTEIGLIKENIRKVINAKDEKALNNEIKKVINQLEVNHSKLFSVNIANACALASVSVGFNRVEIKQENGNLEVIATNSSGQHINSEISTDAKTGNVNAKTETLGITDGSCSMIISNFNDELKKMGIRIGTEKTTFTGGKCQLVLSKMIEQHNKELIRRKKEHERLRKLNSNSKQKI